MYKKNYRWIRIISWKIKHKQKNFKNICIQKRHTNSWPESWDQDKPIKNKLKIIIKPILKKKLMQNDKIVRSWFPNKSNIERWNQEKKINYTKDLKNLIKKWGWKIKKIIRGKTKIFSWRVKLNWKISLTKEKIIQKNDGQIVKNRATKTLNEDENES